MTSIVRHLTQVTATIPSMHRGNKSCRVFLARIMTDEALRSNPTCKFQVNLVDDIQQASQLHVVFRDGLKMDLATASMKPEEILEAVGKHARKLQDKADAMG
ncbi:hypothetical protein THASP1DRAFT_23315 [Thamnocephalis sphaerospora]|uniref:Large ribosomal subunit protein mL53 n=1 Tax=Thamnocephalis sphaerospora TaxID=78915 RepID=A0A4V1IWU1_9FUNG|nr:hypothetical protein THASP1DRAFT_23315 [Thamnocephalis sphaerospora]|eukprot:RKP08739.1 hypothetical protein THASP1DRAFT_23315 [Thamnocephalis sphaerospora]